MCRGGLRVLLRELAERDVKLGPLRAQCRNVGPERIPTGAPVTHDFRTAPAVRMGRTVVDSDAQGAPILRTGAGPEADTPVGGQVDGQDHLIEAEVRGEYGPPGVEAATNEMKGEM